MKKEKTNYAHGECGTLELKEAVGRGVTAVKLIETRGMKGSKRFVSTLAWLDKEGYEWAVDFDSLQESLPWEEKLLAAISDSGIPDGETE